MIEYSVPLAWYKNAYQDKKEACSAARPFSLLHSEKSNKAVLCIHGYTGYPGELVHPAFDLYDKGYDVFVPRLPGHGTSGDDFLASRVEDWLGVIRSAIKDLLSKYEELSLVGHSMGGAIAALCSSEEPRIKKTLLVCPGIYLKTLNGFSAALMGIIGLFKKRIKIEWHSDSEYRMHYEGAPNCDEYLGGEYWSFLYPSMVHQMGKLVKKAKKGIKKIKSPIFVILAENDALVSPDSGEIIKKEAVANVEFEIVKNATHYIFYDKDPKAEERAVELALNFLL